MSDYRARIAAIESGGNYGTLGNEVPGQGRAHGKYQIMPANIGPWTREILGREMTPAEFLASPEAQDAVFNGKFGQYVAKYGPGGAARAWFAGEGGMNNPNAADVNGMTVANYEQKFLGTGGQPVMAQAAPVDPRTAGDADMGGYGGSPRVWDEGKKPFSYADLAGPSGKLGGLGMGLLAAGAPTETWRPMPMQSTGPYRGNAQAASLLDTLTRRGLLG